jgi:hypothetical protein
MLNRGELNELEGALYDALSTGNIIGPENADPALHSSWSASSTVRAELLRQLVVLDPRARSGEARGVRLRGARVLGQLDLEYDELRCPLTLGHCRIETPINLQHARGLSIILEGSHVAGLNARQLTLSGDLDLGGGFACSSELNLMAARIEGHLQLTNARLHNTDGLALFGQRLRVGHSMLCRDLRVTGEVHLIDAHIGGQLALDRATLSNPGGNTVTGDGLTISGGILCHDGFQSIGELRLLNAHIGGPLLLKGVKLLNPGRYALSCDGLTVDRDMRCSDGFEVEGALRLLGARIAGTLNLDGARIQNPDGVALIGAHLTVGEHLHARKLAADGEVQLMNAQIGGELSLTGASLHNHGRMAFRGDGITVARDILSHERLDVDGQFIMPRARIGGSLVLVGPRFRHPEGIALSLESVTIGEAMRCTHGFAVHGKVRLAGAQIASSLHWKNGDLDASEEPAIEMDNTRIGSDTVFDDVGIVYGLSVDGAAFSGEVVVRGRDANTELNLTGARFAGNARLLFNTPLRLDATIVDAPVTLVPQPEGKVLALQSLRDAEIEAPLTIPESVSLEHCTMFGARGLGNINVLSGDKGWMRYRRRRALADEEVARAAHAAERQRMARAVEGSYRQLRVALENSKAAPAAADFYYGEMEMRRLGAPCAGVERILLSVYWLTSGYGLRAGRALASYALAVVAIAAAFRIWTSTFIDDWAAAVGIPSGGHGLDVNHFGDVVAFVARSSISFLSPATLGLTAWGTALILLARFTAPVFLALAVLAIRAHVQR